MRNLQLFGFIFIFLSAFTLESRIRMRKVKEEPKVCALMKLDSNLSRKNKKIYGTLRNSVVFENQISVVGDLGKKTCSWYKEEFLQKMNIPASVMVNEKLQWQFYIDEYKNILIPSVEVNKAIYQATVQLDQCVFSDIKTVEQTDYPDCKPPQKKKKTSQKKSTLPKKKMTKKKAS